MVDVEGTAALDSAADALLGVLLRRVTVSLDLRTTLHVVAQAIVDQLGFGAAVVNVVQPGGVCEVGAVAGPPEARAALLGTHAPTAAFLDVLDRCTAWGELRFLDHRLAPQATDDMAHWTPPDEPSPTPRPGIRTTSCSPHCMCRQVS